MKSSGQYPTILIVEDVDWIRSAMKKAVENLGYRALEATNDASALQLAELDSIELVLTEEQLPTFNALMARLSEHPTLSSVPVVIVNPDAEERARLGEAYLLSNYTDITSLLTGVN